MRRLAAAALMLLAAGLCAPLRAGERMTSASNDLARNIGGGGGAANGMSSTNNRLDAALCEEISGSSASSTNNRIGPGYVHLFAFPGAVTNLTGLDDVSIASVTLRWTAPGADGPQGTLAAGASYFIRVASYTVPDTFTLFSDANIVFSTSGVAPGVTVTTGVIGLIPNTTYSVGVWIKDEAANLSYASRSTFTTLALPPTSLSYANTFPSVQIASVTVAWGALALSPPDASSKTSEGYLLEISSTNFGLIAPGGTVNSSFTANVAMSTLTVNFPDAAVTTNYYRVSSLNWEGRKNYLSIGKMNFQIWQSATLISLGTLDAINRSTVATSSVVVRNVGDLAATFVLSAATATVGGSPWGLSTSSGPDTAVLYGLWNTGPPAPPPASFSTVLTTTARTSGGGGGDYAGDQNGLTVPAGGERSLWFRFLSPTSTSSTAPETISVAVDAVKP